MNFDPKKVRVFIFQYGLLIPTAILWLVLGLYAYLGTFSRYMADDYCEAARVTDTSPVRAAIDRYNDGAWRAANRYSNIMFVGFSEQLGGNSIPITIVGMVVIWAIGISWVIHEARRLLQINWTLAMDLFLSGVFVYFSFVMAPNLYQTVYWRSSMMTHFAPLVFGSLLLGFLLRQARRSQTARISPLTHMIALFSAFLLAGFSEPPTTTLITALPLFMLALWFMDIAPHKNRRIGLVASTFAGVFIGFLIMLLSPAVSDVASEKSNGAIWILLTSFKYAFTFLLDSFKSIPLPFFVSLIVPFLLSWNWKQSAPAGVQVNPRRLFIWMLVLPFITWLLIAAGFAPSVFGQSYPVERMRFLARLLMLIACILEGIWLGLWLPEFKPAPKAGVWVSLIVFIIIAAAYPLRTASNLIWGSIPEYRQRADYWDRRKALIMRKAATGETDLVIPGFSGIYGVKELDDRPDFWVNQCAAQIYGVNSIRTVGVEEEDLENLLNE